MKSVAVCESCGRKKYINEIGYCKRCNQDITNEDLIEEEEEF